MKWADLQSLVPGSANHQIDFRNCLQAFPVLERAKTTPQHPVFHAEGDVWTHTQMVVQELVASREYLSATRQEQEILFFAALLHDVSKYRTTVVDEVTGAIHQPGHSRKGAVESRELLWDYNVPFDIREAICSLIAVHQVPFHAFNDNREGRSTEYLVRKLSWDLNISLLATLAEADIRGRICPDKTEVLDNIALFKELAKEEGCLTSPRDFVDAHTRVSYFRGASVHPDYPLFREEGSKVTVMSGLPASGKDTWVAQNRKGLAVVSFDDAREALGLKHGQNDGAAAHFAVNKAKELLRKKEPFVWNATHLSQQMRSKTLDLLFAYGAEVELVYVEQPRAELLRRNSARNSTLPNKALEALVQKWDLPSRTEAHLTKYALTR